jgi:transcriptional regulator with XRE-family HTH domain
MMHIGTLLRKLRDSRGLTTRAIAEKTGVSLSTYIDWEHDKSSPTMKSYIKLAVALEVDPVGFMAYLTGKAHEVHTYEQSAYLEEMREMVKFYKDYSDLLKKNSLQVESELDRIKQLYRVD